MSYDLWIEDAQGNYLTESVNCTSNVGGMFRLAFRDAEGNPCDGIHGIHGKPAFEAQKMIAKAVAVMLSEADSMRKLNPKNGWGSHDSAVRWLLEFGLQCADHPNGIVRLSA